MVGVKHLMVGVKHLKERIAGIGSSASGAASILGSYQICHSVCTWLISALALAGITVTGMPLSFLQKVALPFWIAAVALLSFSVYISTRHKCVSGKFIMLNSGLIIAGTPFNSVEQFRTIFWILGATIAVFAIMLFAVEKIRGRK